MTEDVSYGYTDRDLLAEPESYEYSEVHGEPFLDAYLADRSEAVESLHGHVTEISSSEHDEGWEGLLSELGLESANGSLVVPEPSGALEAALRSSEASVVSPTEHGVRDTVSTLAALLGYPDSDPPRGDPATAVVDLLTKRFEVEKRLYTTYGRDGRPADESEPADEVAYPLLALTVLLHYDRSRSLKYLNVALKLGDLISSRATDFEDAAAISLSYVALAAERDAVRSLARDKGVWL